MAFITKEITQQQAARFAGAGYLAIIIAGIFAEFIVRSDLIVLGDAEATAVNIAASESLFRLSIAADLVMLIFDVLLAFLLYKLFAPVNKGLSLLAAFFRLVHSAVYGAALLTLMIILILISGADLLASFNAGQTQAFVSLFLKAHSYGYILGLVFFGVHCLILGYLVFASGYFPKILGALLVFASLGYLADSFANILIIDYKNYETVFMMIVFIPAFIGELSFALWLLIKGLQNKPAVMTA